MHHKRTIEVLSQSVPSNQSGPDFVLIGIVMSQCVGVPYSMHFHLQSDANCLTRSVTCVTPICKETMSTNRHETYFQDMAQSMLLYSHDSSSRNTLIVIIGNVGSLR